MKYNKYYYMGGLFIIGVNIGLLSKLQLEEAEALSILSLASNVVIALTGLAVAIYYFRLDHVRRKEAALELISESKRLFGVMLHFEKSSWYDSYPLYTKQIWFEKGVLLRKFLSNVETLELDAFFLVVSELEMERKFQKELANEGICHKAKLFQEYHAKAALGLTLDGTNRLTHKKVDESFDAGHGLFSSDDSQKRVHSLINRYKELSVETPLMKIAEKFGYESLFDSSKFNKF